MEPREHVNRPAAESNLAYQARYRAQPKESDKVVLRLLNGLTGDLLDIGCSNGNLLKHIRAAHPAFRLHGGDLSPLRVETCRSDPELAGITFDVMDAMELPRASFDVVISNAVLCLLNRESYTRAIRSIYAALRPGGRFITFDWMHPFGQDLAITEQTDEIPEGITLYFRSFTTVRNILAAAGFQGLDFRPFEMPFDLPLDHSKAITTHTVNTDAGRMSFRGVLNQPWCHLVSGKAG